MSREYGGYALLQKSEPNVAEADGNPASAQSSTGSQLMEKDFDIVQFASSMFFAHEAAGIAVVIAIRLGALAERCTVQYKTQDKSAIAGENYAQTTGQIVFNANEDIKRFEIPLVKNGHYAPILEFEVIMESSIGCALAPAMSRCRVVICDDDIFPTNAFRESVEQKRLDQIGLRLLGSFIAFCVLRVPTNPWKTCVTLLLDQLHNVYYLVAIKLNIYLVDVVLREDPETEDELWIHGNRIGTTILVAFAMVLPKAVLHCIEYAQKGTLAVAGKARLQLKVNIFRKYLFYSAQSYTKVSDQALHRALHEDVNELMNEGFLVLFKIAQQIVKACVVLYFLIKEQPLIALPLAFYPIAMAVVLNKRYKGTLELDERLKDADTEELTCLMHSMSDLGLIKEYAMRPAVVGAYESKVAAANAALAEFHKYDFKTLLVMPWITILAVAGFTVVGGWFVLSGSISLGFFLAAISIYKDAGELFESFYEHMKNCYTVIGPLLRVVDIMNLPTELDTRMKEAEVRFQGMRQQLDAGMKPPSAEMSRFDMLHIRLVQASLSTDRGGPKNPNLQSISVSIGQGKLVAVLGPHTTGKWSLLRLLKGTLIPRQGQVQVPNHLRCICVPRTPQVFENGDLIQNLTFGTNGDYDKTRLLAICERVGLNDHSMSMIEKALADDNPMVAKGAERVQEPPWYEVMSQSELLKVHIVRAIHFDPEILLLQRPVDEMEASHAKALLEVFREYVDFRGILVKRQYKYEARPHTVFFTSGEDRERAGTASDVADIVLHLSEEGFKSEEGGSPIRVWWCRADNKMVNSWSREAQGLADDLLQERRSHAATKDTLQDVKKTLAAWEKETDEAWLPDTGYTKARLQDLGSRIDYNLQGQKADDPLQEVDDLQKRLQEAILEVEKLRGQNGFLEQKLKVTQKELETLKGSKGKQGVMRAQGRVLAEKYAEKAKSMRGE